MSPEVMGYLEEVRSHLHLDPASEKRVVRELYSHFEEKIAGLRSDGLTEAAASAVALQSFGRPRAIARQMYEAHSRGSWWEAGLAALPHLMLAAMFAFQLWSEPVLAGALLASIPVVTVYGWWHSKPGWLYSWVGYSLLPLFIAGYVSAPALWQATRYVTGAAANPPDLWLIGIVLVLLGASLWIVVKTSINVVKRDWILASLMLVPLPVIGGWLICVTMNRGPFDLHVLGQADTQLSVSLFSLAITSAVFIRLRQRVLKIGALLIVGSIATAVVAHDLWGEAVFAGLLTIALVLLIVLLGPALVEARVGHGDKTDRVWLENIALKHDTGGR